jgi:hypothetical protein
MRPRTPASQRFLPPRNQFPADASSFNDAELHDILARSSNRVWR